MSPETPVTRRQFIGRGAAALVALPAASALLTLAGCGSSASPAASAPPASAPASPSAGSAASKGPLRVSSAYSVAAAPFWPAYIAADSHLFQKYGLDVTFQNMGSGTLIADALVSGSMPAAYVGGTEPMDADQSGSDLVIVASVASYADEQIFTLPSITSPAQLRGKTIAVGPPGNAYTIAAELGLPKVGLTPQKDIAFHVMANTNPANQIAALRSGQVQATVVSPPSTFDAQKEGFHELVNLIPLKIPLGTAVLATSRAQMQNRREEIVSFIKATIEAVAIFRTSQAAATRALSRFTHLTDPTILAKTYDAFRTYYSTDLTVSEAAMATNLRFTNKPQDGPPSKYYDNSLVRSLASFTAQIDRSYHLKA